MDQAGLGAAQRAANLAGRFGVRTSLLRAAEDLGHLVLVDDVITTGATLRESQRALEEAGLRTGGAAVMAATLRRSPSR